MKKIFNGSARFIVEPLLHLSLIQRSVEIPLLFNKKIILFSKLHSFRCLTNCFIRISLTGTNNPTAETASYAPSRKQFKPTREDILRNDQLANEAMSKAYERAVQLNTTLKAIVT